MTTKKTEKVRIAAVGDIHVHEGNKIEYEKLFADIEKDADILLLCGDLTQRGLTEEAELLIEYTKKCSIPILAVLGNHDFESNKVQELKEYLINNNVKVLDGESTVVKGVGFAGVKGFCGGFDTFMLDLWGEDMIKKFYYEGFNEAQKLEEALAQLHTKKKVVLLHYAPIRETVIGEPEEIFTYLGSSRLESPINSFDVNLVFHGHAHRGTYEGKTTKEIPVYNVSYAIMSHRNSKRPYAIVEI